MGKTVTTPPSVAIVIVAFNDPANITRLFTSLDSLAAGPTLHTVIIDNSTDPAAAKTVAQLVQDAPAGLGASYHKQTGNLGFAGGVNAGLHAATADYYWLINSDTTVDAQALNQLLATAIRTHAAAVGSLILYGDDKTVYYAGGTASDWLGIVRHPGRNVPPATTDSTRPVTFINGCSLFLPASTITQYGELFEPYFMYYEETDLCGRIRRGGGTLYYEPASIVYHFTRHTDDKSAGSVYYLTRNHWLYVSRNLRGIQQLTARLAICCFQLYRLLRYLFQSTIRTAIIAGWRDALTHHYGPRPR